MLIGFTSLLIFFWTFWSPFYFILFVCKFQRNLCLHTAFLQSLNFLAAGSLDKKKQSKPHVCLNRIWNSWEDQMKKLKGKVKRLKGGDAYWKKVRSQKVCTDAPWYHMSCSLIGRLLLELIRPVGWCFMNVPQVMVIHYFNKPSNTAT